MIICSALLLIAIIIEIRSFPLTTLAFNSRTQISGKSRYHQQQQHPFTSNTFSARRSRLLTLDSNGDEITSDHNYASDDSIRKSDNSTSSKGDSLRSTILVAMRDIRRQLSVKIRLQCDNLIRNVDSAMLDKALTSSVGFFIADFMAQSLQFKMHIPRLLRMSLFGFCIHGALGYLFYRWLMTAFEGRDINAVLKRVITDQLLFIPFLAVQLLVFTGVLKGHAPYQIYQSCQARLLYLVAVNWLIWPISHLFNFRFVPAPHRQLFLNLVQIITNMLHSIIVNK